MTEQGYFYGTGRRKTAVAQVRLVEGNGAVIVNGKPFEEVFKRGVLQTQILQPLEVTNTHNRFNSTAPNT